MLVQFKKGKKFVWFCGWTEIKKILLTNIKAGNKIKFIK